MWDSLERCKDTMAPERVPEFLARVCFTIKVKTISFCLPGMWAVVDILALHVGRMLPMVQTSFLPD